MNATLSHVFVSSDFKYFKVSHKDCLRSPCIEIIHLVTHVNVALFPAHFITPLTSATLAVAFATGNIPFEMTIKPLDETMKIFQNLHTYQQVMQSVGEFANTLLYQQLYAFYAQSVIQSTPAPTVTTITKESQVDDSVKEDVSVYIIDDDTADISKNTCFDDDMLGIFGDDEGMDTDIDAFLEELCNNNELFDLQL